MSEKITKDFDGVDVDSTKYSFIIGSLLYLTTSKLDIAFSVGAYVRYQVHQQNVIWKWPRESFDMSMGQLTLVFGIYLMALQY